MTNYKQFSQIKKAFRAEKMKQQAETAKRITSGEIALDGWYIKELLTKKERTQTPTQQKKKAIQKLKARTLKEIELFNKEADAIAQAPTPKNIYINITWKKSAVWGYNPFCEVWNGGEYTTGRASGCGYDKRSAAVAQAFNQNKSILKIIYILFEKGLRKNPRGSLRDLVGYGSGYVARPLFDGGVGYGCYQDIFNKAGAKLNTWRQGSSWDSMVIEF